LAVLPQAWKVPAADRAGAGAFSALKSGV